jgi:hypothetical protein
MEICPDPGIMRFFASLWRMRGNEVWLAFHIGKPANDRDRMESLSIDFF